MSSQISIARIVLLICISISCNLIVASEIKKDWVTASGLGLSTTPPTDAEIFDNDIDYIASYSGILYKSNDLIALNCLRYGYLYISSPVPIDRIEIHWPGTSQKTGFLNVYGKETPYEDETYLKEGGDPDEKTIKEQIKALTHTDSSNAYTTVNVGGYKYVRIEAQGSETFVWHFYVYFAAEDEPASPSSPVISDAQVTNTVISGTGEYPDMNDLTLTFTADDTSNKDAGWVLGDYELLVDGKRLCAVTPDASTGQVSVSHFPPYEKDCQLALRGVYTKDGTQATAQSAPLSVSIPSLIFPASEDDGSLPEITSGSTEAWLYHNSDTGWHVVDAKIEYTVGLNDGNQAATSASYITGTKFTTNGCTDETHSSLMTASLIPDNPAETSIIPLENGRFTVMYGHIACSNDGSFSDDIEIETSFSFSYPFVVAAESTSTDNEGLEERSPYSGQTSSMAVVTKTSSIVKTTITPAGITLGCADSITASEADVKATYHTLHGRVLPEPPTIPGIYIARRGSSAKLIYIR